jgi:hypothetical protein
MSRFAINSEIPVNEEITPARSGWRSAPMAWADLARSSCRSCRSEAFSARSPRPRRSVETSASRAGEPLDDCLSGGRRKRCEEAALMSERHFAAPNGHDVHTIHCPSDSRPRRGGCADRWGRPGRTVSPNGRRHGLRRWRRVPLRQPCHLQNNTEIADGLAAALRRRGLIRSSYTNGHFRDNLLEF